jgi:predicted dehydrogenase
VDDISVHARLAEPLTAPERWRGDDTPSAGINLIIIAILAQIEKLNVMHWMVAENWRYETAFLRAKEIIDSGAIGQVRLCHCTSMVRISSDNRYYATDWRRSEQYQGGFVLDAGVHHMALLRALMGEVMGVTAQSTQMRPDLPPADSVAATLHFDSGAIGVYLVSYAFDTPWQDWLQVTGDEGSLRVQRGRIELVTQNGENSLACQTYDGVQRELGAFAETLRNGAPHRNTPEEALCDLAAIEAMLRAAETGETIAPATF